MVRNASSKLRVIFWLISGFFKKHLKIFSLSFLVSILLFLLIRSILPVIVPILVPLLTPQKDRIALVGSYTPSTLPLSIQSLISNGLTSVTLEGSPAAALAREWSPSKDGKTYIFKLREDIKWHDNKHFTALDVNYNLKGAIIVPKNEYELEVKLNEAYVPLPVLLSKPLFKKGLIGVGSYKVKSLKLNGDILEYLELVPVSGNKPRKIFRFYQNEDKAITAFKLGEIDVIEDLTDPKELNNWKTVEISEKVLLNRYVGLLFNTKHEYFKEKENRQILSLSSPSVFGEKPIGPISPLSWAYYPKVKQYEQNLALAQKRLTETRLATSSAKLIISTFSNLLPIANKIKTDWNSIGLNTEIRVENTVPLDFQILLATQEIPPDPDQYPLWHSVQTTTNITKLANPKIDKLLEDGRIIKDTEERLNIYADFQRFLAEEAPVAFLYYPRVYTVKRK